MSVHTLYRFYSPTNELLYIGLTVNPGRRMEQHRGKSWWAEIGRIEMEQHSNLDALRVAERKAIQAERPLHNIRMNEGISTVEKDSAVDIELDGLVGRWFHSYTTETDMSRRSWRPESIEWQGQILAREGDGFVVQLYSWWDGTPLRQRLVPYSELATWSFYDSAAEMQMSQGCQEHFIGSSAHEFNSGVEGTCGRPCTHKTGLGAYGCSRCSTFYADVLAVT